ncbi:MAG: hypothetical protein Q9163_001535 [Psora crenata]
MSLLPSLERTLSGEVKAMITQCSIRHLYALPSSGAQKELVIATAKSLERRRCNHHMLEQPLSTFDCLSSVVDPKSVSTGKNLVNRFNYVVAVQDEEVRRWCRGVRGVPLVYVKRSVMVMEPMAEGSAAVREGMERGKFRSGLRGKVAARPEKRKREEKEEVKETAGDDAGEGEDGSEIKKKKRSKGPKGPNPLSVKKPKKETVKVGKYIGELEPGDGEVGLADDIISVGEEATSEDPHQPAAKRRKRRKHRSKKKPEDVDSTVDGGGKGASLI